MGSATKNNWMKSIEGKSVTEDEATDSIASQMKKLEVRSHFLTAF